MLLDAAKVSRTAFLSADVCVVGGGPVGLASAWDLAASGMTVVLLESGRPGAADHEAALNEGGQEGDPYAGPAATRARGPGGTARIWNTVHRGIPMAKYLPLEPEDFSLRGDGMGWPFDHRVLEPWYRRAQECCGLGPLVYAGDRWAQAHEPLLALEGSGLETRVYQFGPAARFAEELPEALAKHDGVTLIHGATATRFHTASAGERVAEAEWASLGGQRGRVRAATFVLAAGALENARLLLLMAEDWGRPGLGGPWLGRGFMEHPVDRSLELRTRAHGLAQGPGFYRCHDTAEGLPVMGRLAPGAELQQRAGGLNASVRLLLDDTPALLQAGAPRAVARRLVPGVAVRRVVGGAVRRMARLVQGVRPARYRLLVDLEQRPHRDNRVTLGNRRDALGRQRLTLHWRWRSQDEALRRGIVEEIARAVERAGAGQIHQTGESLDPNAHHHAGTTRMHPDPSEGVVDESLRVHGMENLYVAGSSAFPTSGFANPTLTAVALALRLADHLISGDRP